MIHRLLPIVCRAAPSEATVPAIAEVTVAHGGASGVAFAWEQQLLNAGRKLRLPPSRPARPRPHRRPRLRSRGSTRCPLHPNVQTAPRESPVQGAAGRAVPLQPETRLGHRGPDALELLDQVVRWRRQETTDRGPGSSGTFSRTSARASTELKIAARAKLRSAPSAASRSSLRAGSRPSYGDVTAYVKLNRSTVRTHSLHMQTAYLFCRVRSGDEADRYGR